LVGEKCDLGFQLRDAGGDGWKGASISVTDQNGQRIAIITMKEGAEQTLTLPLLKGNLNFIWNSGWYHDKEQYDTDGECSFTILNGEDEVIFTSATLSPGIFFTYQNNCGQSVEEDLAQRLLVYPNPTNGLLHIEGEGTMWVSISNSLGQTIMETTVEGNAILDLSRFGSGMYLVRFETENGIMVQKVNLSGLIIKY
ncbi:MAG: T9SS type A sorting domain-containing protein, partial [Bacteroidales bacterium]|nr:T9SS type A sorting domain-containing protein [Bacteroidales bacterium]